MDGKRTPRALIAVAGLLTALVIAGCSTQTVEDEGTPPAEGEAPVSELSAFDQAAAAQVDTPPPADEFQDFGGNEAALENELNNQPQAQQEPAPADDFAGFEQPQEQQAPPPEPAPIDQPPAIDPGQQTAELPPPVEAPAPEIAPPPPISDQPVTITSLKFKANDNGGTVVVEADGPMQFSQRMNPDNQQFVIDIPNSKLGKKAKRSLNTKDFAGIVGAIDAYQEKNSTTSHVVVQLRSGDLEPTVQAEGNSLLVVTSPSGAGALAQAPADIPPPVMSDPGTLPPPVDAAAAPPPVEQEENVAGSKLMTSDNLEQFISNNQTFYGKKISIETDEVEVRDVFKLIGEEANVNMILAEDVKGKVSVKLKNVPWDQALVLLMKTKKLGYTRSGNVIRISNLADLRAEEKDALEIQNQRRQNAVPKVRTVQVNYAKIEDLPNQIKGLLTKNGTVVADARTSSLIISDLEDNIERAVTVIRSLDIPPQQVLIEGKIVEAKDDFELNMGINWRNQGSPFAMGGSSVGPAAGSGDVTVRPDLGANNTFQLDIRMGTFDILGDLSATLALFEVDKKVKILSSPRIVTMHNEKANIQQVLEVPIRASTTSNGVVTNAVNFKEAKLELEVTPQITNDGAVMMGVKIQREFFGAIVDVASGAREANKRGTQTRVMVRNGQTAVIGGIYQNDATSGESRVPYLGKLPVIGWLFKSTTQSETKNELLVFLTPRILGQLDSQVIPSQNNMNNNGLPPPAPSADPSLEPGLEF